MNDAVKTVANYVAYFSEGIAILIIFSGIAASLWIYVRKAPFLKDDFRGITESRNRLGHSLSLALEFLIGADILKTAISPSWQDIGQLAAIVGIRTFLNFFLTRELRQPGVSDGPL